MEFEEWSNKKKEQEAFSQYAAEKKNAAQPVKASYSAPYYGAGDAARLEPTKATQPMKPLYPEKTTAPARSRGGITLHPGIEEIDRQAKAAQNQAAVTPAQKPAMQIPSAPIGQSVKLGETNAPEPFTFSASPKAEIPANRFSPFDATRLPGWQARTGMVLIPSSVDISSEKLLAEAPLGAYTNNWNNEGAGAPAASVFAGMNDETLSQLIGAYSDQMQRLKSEGLLGNSDQGFDWSDIINLGEYAANAAGLQADRFQIVTPRDIPTPGSQPGVPGTIMFDADPGFSGKGFSSADDVFKFRLEDGEINVSGLDYMLENGDLSELEKIFYKAFDGVEVPEYVANLVKNSDRLANAAKVIKNGGTALGIIGAVLDAYEVANTAYDDYYDEDPGMGKKALSSIVSAIGGWGGGSIVAKIGAMGGAATGTLICPVFGTVIGGIIGGVVGGIAGAKAGRESTVFLFDEVYLGN